MLFIKILIDLNIRSYLISIIKNKNIPNYIINKMSNPIYKVIFKGINNIDQDKLNLIFKGFTSDGIIFPSEILSELKIHVKNNQNITIFQNISEVIELGKEISSIFKYYFIILLTSKKGKKMGFLIGNKKKSGDIIIGTWPFNEDFSHDKILATINNLIKNLNDFKEICLIN